MNPYGLLITLSRRRFIALETATKLSNIWNYSTKRNTPLPRYRGYEVYLSDRSKRSERSYSQPKMLKLYRGFVEKSYYRDIF